MPVALLLLTPVIVNIIAFHVFLAPRAIPPAIVVSALEIYLAWQHREVFSPMFRGAPRQKTIRTTKFRVQAA